MKRKNRSDNDGGEEGMRENSRGFSKIDEETLKYYAEIDAHFKTIEDDEEKHLLAENVLAETAGREADIVPDAACSRVLESLLPFASPSSLEKFTQNCIGGDNLGIICTSGPFGSHVLEKILLSLSNLASTAPDDDTYAIAQKSLAGFTEASVDSLYHMITSKYGSFVARKLLCILCGRDVAKPPPPRNQLPATATAVDDMKQEQIPSRRQGSKKNGLIARITNASADNDNKKRRLHASSSPYHTSNTTFPDLLRAIVETVVSDEWTGPELSAVQNDQFAGPFLQALLRATTAIAESAHGKDEDIQAWSALTAKLVVHLLGGTPSVGIDSVTSDTLLRLMTDRNGSHLMEAIFESAPEDMLQKLCTAAFRGRLPAMAQHPSANFAVQAALASLRRPQQLKRMFEDLRPHFAALLRGRRAGVVTLLLAAAKRLSCLESDCSSALWHALESGFAGSLHPSNAQGGVQTAIWTPMHTLLTLDTTITNFASPSSPSPRLSSLGCVALVTLFQYPAESIKQWTTALFDLAPGEAASIARDPGGCRVIETYLRGPGGSSKRRKKMMQALAGNWASIASTGAGARFIEQCVMVAELEEQEQIARELAAAEKRISVLPWGGVLLRRCHVDAYTIGSHCGGENVWKNKVEKAAATRKEFEELFGDDDGHGDGNAVVKDSVVTNADTQKRKKERTKDGKKKMKKKATKKELQVSE